MALGTTGLVVAAALTAGVAGAGVAALVMETSRPAAPPAAAIDTGHLAALEERLARQEEEIHALQGRIEMASTERTLPAAVHNGTVERVAATTPSGSPADGSGPAPSDIDSVSTLSDGGASPAELARFQTLYKAMREKEQEESRKSRLVAAEVQLRERLDRATDLNLTAEQKESVVRILMGRNEKVRQIFEASRAPGTTPGPDTFRAIQEQAAAARTEAHQALEALLTPEQLKVIDNVDPGGRNNERPGGRQADGIPRRPNGGRRAGAGGSQDPPK